jgi:YggT family protein
LGFNDNGFIGDLVGIIRGLLNFFMIILMVRVLLSWFSPSPFGPFGRVVQMLYALTDPVLDATRRRMPQFMWSTGLDFTPLVLIILLQIVDSFLSHIIF